MVAANKAGTMISNGKVDVTTYGISCAKQLKLEERGMP
jgi:hypothetical protein